jgi:hypothetical protein
MLRQAAGSQQMEELVDGVCGLAKYWRYFADEGRQRPMYGAITLTPSVTLVQKDRH